MKLFSLFHKHSGKYVRYSDMVGVDSFENVPFLISGDWKTYFDDDGFIQLEGEDIPIQKFSVEEFVIHVFECEKTEEMNVIPNQWDHEPDETNQPK